VRIAKVGHGRSQPTGAADRPVFGLESEFVDDVVGLAVLVVIDVENVPHVVGKVEVIGPVARVLSWIHIHDESGLPLGRQPPEVCRVLADKRVNIGVIGSGVHGNKGGFAMARGKRRGAPGPPWSSSAKQVRVLMLVP
jgi:hypothetical protein